MSILHLKSEHPPAAGHAVVGGESRDRHRRQCRLDGRQRPRCGRDVPISPPARVRHRDRGHVVDGSLRRTSRPDELNQFRHSDIGRLQPIFKQFKYNGHRGSLFCF